MTKSLNEKAIRNELENSAFFKQEKSRHPSSPKENEVTTVSSDDGTMTPRHHDTVIPRYHDLFLEDIRKALKSLGKEAATHRFTQKEKTAVADLIHHYKKQGIRTSENEITRIAINFILEDFKEFGEDSILHITFKLLNE